MFWQGVKQNDGVLGGMMYISRGATPIRYTLIIIILQVVP